MADSIDSVLIISLPEIDKLQLYRTTEPSASSLIRVKSLRKVILNRLNAQPEEIIARFRAGRSVTNISSSVKSAFSYRRICIMSS